MSADESPPPFTTVDLTSDVSQESRSQDRTSLESNEPAPDSSSNLADEERGFARAGSGTGTGNGNGNGKSTHSHFSSGSGNASERTDETELQSRRGSVTSDSSAFVKRKTSQFMDAIRGNQHKGNTPLPAQIATLVEAYAASDIAAGIRAEIDGIANRNPDEELPSVAEEDRLLRGRRGASWLTQFRILSGRAFKNLYRDPALLTAHYLSSIILARMFYFYALICLVAKGVSMASNLRILLPQC